MARIEQPPAGMIDLKEARRLLQAGALSKLQGQVSVDLTSAGEEEIFALLELLCYRSGDHRLLRTSQATALVERARNRIHLGEFERTLRDLESAPEPGDPDIILEKARAKGFLGDYEGALEALGPAELDPWTGRAPANSTGVACQIRGHALLELGKLAESRQQLLEAVRVGELIGNSVGVYAAALFLWKLSAIEGDATQAERWREQSALLISEQIQSLRWLLGYYRMRSHVRYLTGRSEAGISAVAAILIARALEDELFEDRGYLELALMIGGKPHPRAASLISKPGKHDSVEYRAWLAAVSGQPVARQPHTLELFRACAPLAASPLEALESGWIYDEERQALLDPASGKGASLIRSSSMVRILRLLNEADEPILVGDCFEKVWKLRWNPDRHAASIKVTLLRMNKLVPGLRILREDGTLRLQRRGLILSR
jgi:hypothetical protein